VIDEARVSHGLDNDCPSAIAVDKASRKGITTLSLRMEHLHLVIEICFFHELHLTDSRSSLEPFFILRKEEELLRAYSLALNPSPVDMT